MSFKLKLRKYCSFFFLALFFVSFAFRSDINASTDSRTYRKTKQVIVSNHNLERTSKLRFCRQIQIPFKESMLEYLSAKINVNKINHNISSSSNNFISLLSQTYVKEKQPKVTEYSLEIKNVDYYADVDEIFLLACIIWCEAGNQCYEGKVAVGNVVLNRVASQRYPNTIVDVIFQRYQFEPVTTGWFQRVVDSGEVNDSCMQAALDALAGINFVGDRCGFHVWNGKEDGLVIQAHVFK